MNEYRQMVFQLYNAATDAIYCTDKEQANQILRDANIRNVSRAADKG